MRKRKRNSFAKIGTLAIVLVVALGIMGVGYGVWSHTVSTNGTMYSGEWGITLNNCDCDNPPLSCSPSGNVLHVDVDVDEADPLTAYNCTFTIINPGSVPVDISPDLSSYPSGVEITVTDTGEESLEGAQIDPGMPVDGKVQVYFTTVPGDDFDFEITFNFMVWTQ